MPRFSVFACSVLRSWFANLLPLLYSMISPYIMQKMEGISYDHRRFIFARKNLHDDGVPFGDYNYRRAITSARYIFSASGIVYCSTNSTPPFTAYHNYPSDRLNSGTSAISGRKRKKKSKETDTTLSDRNRRFAYLKKKDTEAMQLPTQPSCVHCGAIRFYKESAGYMFKIRVKDPTGELDVTVFGEPGMNIFNMKEYQFKAKYSSVQD
ncbi:hypothetical protein OROHE_002654 [Orobanche hederae]